MELSDHIIQIQAEAIAPEFDGAVLTLQEGERAVADLSFPVPGIISIENGILTGGKLSPALEPSGGTLDNYLIRKLDGTIISTGSIGLPGSGADLEIKSIKIPRGAEVHIDNFVHVIPRGN